MDVSHIAKLANLTLTPEEARKLEIQFTETLKAVEVINELDTTGIQPTSQVTGLLTVLRPDVIDTSRLLPPPSTPNHYYVVPAVL